MPPADRALQRTEDHSWMDVIEAREKERQLEKAGYVRQ